MAEKNELKTIKVRNAEGKEIEVTEKAFNVVYNEMGYEQVGGTKKKKDDK